MGKKENKQEYSGMFDEHAKARKRRNKLEENDFYDSDDVVSLSTFLTLINAEIEFTFVKSSFQEHID